MLTMVAPLRRTEEILQALRALMLPLRAAQGFIECRLYQAADDARTICYLEEWQSAEALDRQIRSSHYTRLMTLLEEAAEPPEVRVEFVSDVRGLEYLESVRLCAG